MKCRHGPCNMSLQRQDLLLKVAAAEQIKPACFSSLVDTNGNTDLGVYATSLHRHVTVQVAKFHHLFRQVF